jgi:hypothetical protein
MERTFEIVQKIVISDPPLIQSLYQFPAFD